MPAQPAVFLPPPTRTAIPPARRSAPTRKEGTLIQRAFYPCGIPAGRYDVPQGVLSVGSHAFANSSLTAMTIPESVSSIGSYAFYWCDLREVTIPGNIKSIGPRAFEYCRDLQKATLLDGVESIDYWAFANCKLLRDVTLPGSLTSIHATAFAKGHKDLTLMLEHDSYAVEYAKANGVSYTYADVSNDWLND